jgi:hypothetical protein
LQNLSERQIKILIMNAIYSIFADAADDIIPNQNNLLFYKHKPYFVFI